MVGPDRFTKEANSVLNHSHKVLRQFKHATWEKEHVLLALLEQSDVAISIVDSLLTKNHAGQYTVIDIRHDVARALSAKEVPSFQPNADIIISAGLSDIVDSADQLSRKMGYKLIGSEHLLLVLCQETDLTILLRKYGVDTEALYAAIKVTQGDGESDCNDQVKTPGALARFGVDLTALARDGKLDPVIGREKEIQMLMQVLICRTKCNPALIGEAGVGKTAVVEGLAQKIASGDVPSKLKDRKIVSINVAAMLAGTEYRGTFERRLMGILDEVTKSNRKVIMFIDEFHTVVRAGAVEGGSLDFGNILKPALARGDVQLIGATTKKEYRTIEKDAALERRMSVVSIEEPSVTTAIEMVKGLRSRYEKHHQNITISDEAIEAAVKLSKRYIPDRLLPDKAITLIDETAAKLVLMGMTGTMGQEHITAYISDKTGIPVSKLTGEGSKRLVNMEKDLQRRVVGQEHAIATLSDCVRRGRAGLKDPRRPAGAFIFLGPTGVGKTELVKAMAEFLFNDADAMVRFDMSEYKESHSVSKLIGSPPGYVGYEDTGQLTEAVRRRPYCILLFDEIEKAHPDVCNTLLQVLEDGRLTDSHGVMVSFKETVVVMTSNLGTGMQSRSDIGFVSKEDGRGDMHSSVESELRRFFKPEFLNRIDEVVIFNQLTKADLLKIVDLLISEVNVLLEEKKITLVTTLMARQWLINTGYDPSFGARPLRRTIQRYVTNVISNKILNDELKEGDIVSIDLVEADNKLAFNMVVNAACLV